MHRAVARLAISLLVTIAGAVQVANGGPAEPPDWDALAEVETIQVLSENEDATLRDTTVWLVVVDGQGYIRTGGTRWGANVARQPDVTVQIGDADYALTVRYVDEEDLRQRITAAFREKYGIPDAVMSLFRGSRPTIMRLDAR